MGESVSVPGERDAWEAMERAWHVVSGLLAAGTGALVITGDGPVALPLGLLGGIVVAYAVAGGRALHRPAPSRLGVGYVLVAGPLVLALFAATPDGAILLCVLFPQIWRYLTTRWAIAATVAVVAAIGALLAVASAVDAPEILGWMALMTAIALLLGLWISRITDQSTERAALLAELGRTRDELAAASRDLGALAERERLAREIHDTLAQGFTSILLLAQSGEGRTWRLVEQTARENLAESRALVAATAPAGLGSTPLPAALRRLVERFADELGIAATMRVDGTERALPAGQDVVLLRVSQEALANVRKHAGASRLELVLTFGPGGAAVRISDDGRGFDPAEPGSGFGLAGMRERVREIGGALDLRSGPGGGTCVEVRLA